MAGVDSITTLAIGGVRRIDSSNLVWGDKTVAKFDKLM
jgi:hypothetical protein